MSSRGVPADGPFAVDLLELGVGLRLGLEGVALDIGLERVGVDEALNGVDLLLGGLAVRAGGPGGGCRAHVDADLDLVVPVALHGGDLRLQQSRGADEQ